MNITLNNGVKMPLLGFGTYQLRDEQAILHALNTGYRLIDTAAVYNNEELVGNAIKKSNIKREEIFVTTKFLPPENAKRACESSLKKLRLDYIDLFLIHLPQGDIHATWTTMEELYAAGKVRAIGVSNFNMNQLPQHGIVPAVNQVETHPFSQKKSMQQALTARGIQLQSWAPFAQGKNNLFNNGILKGIAEKNRKSIAQVVLRWLIQRQVVVIPKSADKERITGNFDVFDFELAEDDISAIEKLDKGAGMIYYV